MRTDPAEAIALFRYRVIADALDPHLRPRERGALIRHLAAQPYTGPDGVPRVLSRNTLDRWLRAYREQGLAGLKPQLRSDQGLARRQPDLLREAEDLRRELPSRSSAQISAILLARHGVRVASRTLRQHFQRHGLQAASLGTAPKAYGRFEASRPNELWIGDVLVGPLVPTTPVDGVTPQRAYLFVLVDDYSRLLVHGRWLPEQTARAGQQVLRAAIQRRGKPERLYVDNGAPYANEALERTCAVLGIRLIHSRPYQPEGRGKQERLNRFIRERFLSEAEAIGIRSLPELNDRFSAWAEQVCNTRVHAETGQTPISRFLRQGPQTVVEPSLLREAFRWAVQRRVTRTASVSLAGHRYAVDPALVDRQVELRFDPEDLSRLEVYWEGRSMGSAIPFIIGRHVRRQVPPPPPASPPISTGVDYLGLVLAQQEEQVLGEIAFRHLPVPEIIASTPAVVTAAPADALEITSVSPAPEPFIPTEPPTPVDRTQELARPLAMTPVQP